MDSLVFIRWKKTNFTVKKFTPQVPLKLKGHRKLSVRKISSKLFTHFRSFSALVGISGVMYFCLENWTFSSTFSKPKGISELDLEIIQSVGENI